MIAPLPANQKKTSCDCIAIKTFIAIPPHSKQFTTTSKMGGAVFFL